MEATMDKQPACGHPDCDSVTYDGSVRYFGRDGWDYGDGEECLWATPCFVCAQAYKAQHPDEQVWPTREPAVRTPRYTLVTTGHAPGCGHSQPHMEVRNPTVRERKFIQGVLRASHMADPAYHARHDCQAFLQGDTKDWILIEFWTDDLVACQRFVDYLNDHYPVEV